MSSGDKKETLKMQRVRGTQDFFPETNLNFRWVESQARKCSQLYGFGEIQTPILEFTDVFSRTLGETSDVVQKETYSFIDRGSEHLTLRPEGTAGIARSFISEGLAQNLPLKFFYTGPMFRHERPQKGRYRQFHQIGVEYLGHASPQADVEVLSLAWDILKKLGLDSAVVLEINTLGDSESRQKYRSALVEYYENHKASLSADSLLRLEKNPLRILDSKDEGDRKLNADAPTFESFLNSDSQNFFETVLKSLQQLQIPFRRNHKLVRGLDYYCHTVFEFVTTQLGAQGTVLAGGRYDGLIETMGGQSTPGVGWAAGIERLCELTPQRHAPKTQVYILPADDDGENHASAIAHLFRQQGLITEILLSGNMGKKMKKASQAQAEYACIVGSQEIANRTVALKNLISGEQKNISWDDLSQLKGQQILNEE